MLLSSVQIAVFEWRTFKVQRISCKLYGTRRGHRASKRGNIIVTILRPTAFLFLLPKHSDVAYGSIDRCEEWNVLLDNVVVRGTWRVTGKPGKVGVDDMWEQRSRRRGIRRNCRNDRNSTELQKQAPRRWDRRCRGKRWNKLISAVDKWLRRGRWRP